MTGGTATARVWLATLGVVTGIALRENGVTAAAAAGSAVVGLLLVVTRRRAALAVVGILLLSGGLAALRAGIPAVEPSPPGRVVATYRSALTASLGSVADEPAALLSGLTIGDTSRVHEETTEAFRRSGLSHLVAVSGSNVAMVLAAIAIVTIGLPLLVRGGVALGALCFYVAVVGPEPSVLRAAAMGVVGLVAYVIGRQAASLNSLGIALTVVLVAKPDLLFSIGLHLSAAATLGIVVWSSPFERAMRRVPALLRAPIAITLSAQIAVAPLLIIAFGELSLVAPVANVLAAPAVPPATVLGLAGGVGGMIFDPLGRAIGAAAAPFAQWILWVAHETAGWSWASISVAPSWGAVLAIPVGGAAIAGAVLRAGR